MNSALFLDRDGVINVDYGYVHAKDNFVFNEEIFDLVSFANSKNSSTGLIQRCGSFRDETAWQKDFPATVLRNPSRRIQMCRQLRTDRSAPRGNCAQNKTIHPDQFHKK